MIPRLLVRANARGGGEAGERRRRDRACRSGGIAHPIMACVELCRVGLPAHAGSTI